MKFDISFQGTVQRFPGVTGWHYLAVPKKYTKILKQQRKAWGMFPIIASVKKTVWNTKLMTKKGGDFFIALKASIRKKENISAGDTVRIFFRLT